MKKTYLLLTLMLTVSMLMQAQANRRPAAKKSATAAKKPAAKVNNNFAVLEFDEWINHIHLTSQVDLLTDRDVQTFAM